MRPILFHLGPLPIYSFGVLIACGIMISLGLMNRRAKADGFPQGEGAFDLVFLTVMSGFLGARLYYVLQNADWYLKHPLKVFALWEGGLIFYGGMAGAILGLWIYSRAAQVSLAKILDFLLPYTALTHAFGRLGCFMNGCCYGKVCELPWAVKVAELPHRVHPAQLYEAALDLCLFAFLNQRYSKKKFQGEISALYFLFYALIRFVVEFFRADNPALGPFSINQWISLAVAVLASCYYFKRRRVSLAETQLHR